MSPKKKIRKDPAYIREQGKKKAQDKKQRKLSFSLTKHITTQGQTFEQWDELGFLGLLNIRMKFVGQFSVTDAYHNGCLKQYTKVGFPPNSNFKEPKHIIVETWTTMHITSSSKEIVAGFIEDDIFYIIFLDKEHDFWPTELKHT